MVAGSIFVLNFHYYRFSLRYIRVFYAIFTRYNPKFPTVILNIRTDYIKAFRYFGSEVESLDEWFSSFRMKVLPSL
jgi:hypothetical protein